jgi:hypothetical protein
MREEYLVVRPDRFFPNFNCTNNIHSRLKVSFIVAEQLGNGVTQLLTNWVTQFHSCTARTTSTGSY